MTIDTLRADRVGAWGYPAARTPVLDRLAGEGVRFAECQSPVPVTLPAHASIMTGRYPPDHGVRNNTSYRLPDDVPTLAGLLGGAGYQTGAFVAAFPLAPRFGLDRGFDTYDASLPDASANPFEFRERAATEVVRAAVDWLAGRQADEPVFLWVHFFEPHAPYQPDPAWTGDPYDGEVAEADRALGLLLDRFVALRGASPLTAVTSDHGEGLGEHGEASHAIFLYQTTLHVPLVLHDPRRWPAGVVVEEPVSLVDLAPTLLVAVGVDPTPLAAAGTVLHPDGEIPRRALYSESVYGMEAYRWAPLFALRTGPEKVIRSRRSRAFDLASDPRELDDLLPHDLQWPIADLEALDARIAGDSLRRPGAARQPTPDELEALAALGYAGVSAPEAPELVLALRELPDASERGSEFVAIHRAEGLLNRGETGPAMAELQRVLDANPENVWGWMLMERTLGAEDRTPEAIAACERAIALRPDWLELHRDLARLRTEAGDPGGAAEAWDEVLRLDPGSSAYRLEAAAALQEAGDLEQARALLDQAPAPRDDREVQAGLARICFQLDRLEEGRVALRRARQLRDDEELRRLAALYARRAGEWEEVLQILDPAQTSPEDLELRGEALQRLDRIDEAVRTYERALATNDRLPLAQNNLAWALATGLDRPADALAHARRAVELRPEEPEFHDTLVEVLLRLGREDEARIQLERALQLHPAHPALQRRARAIGLR